LSQITTWNYPASGMAGAIELQQGDEMGRFLLGSTVVMLWPAKSELMFNAQWHPAKGIRLGESMAQHSAQKK
jgi:phosphatidylserine decarboxylase